MERAAFIFVVAFTFIICCQTAPEMVRVRRGFGGVSENSRGGYGRGGGSNSRERDASVSGEGACSGESPRSNSGGSSSREIAYNRQGGRNGGRSSTTAMSASDASTGSTGPRGGRSFAKASASSSSFNERNKIM